MANEKSLLSIIELGGYPDFGQVYKRYGYERSVVYSMRKALTLLKKISPKVIVAEFNYQSDFRDRTSSLESLIAVAQQNPDVKLIIFYEKEYLHQLEKLTARYNFFATFAYPIEEQMIVDALTRLEMAS